MFLVRVLGGEAVFPRLQEAIEYARKAIAGRARAGSGLSISFIGDAIYLCATEPHKGAGPCAVIHRGQGA